MIITRVNNNYKNNISEAIESQFKAFNQSSNSFRVSVNTHWKSDVPFRPLVICGPSGSGKSTLLKRLMTEFEDFLGFSVSRKF